VYVGKGKNKLKLIIEECKDIQYIVESKGGTKTHFLTGIFAQAEQQNKNGRVYPLSILSREIERYNKDYIQKNRALGELGHPDNPSINLDRVSHMITSLTPDGNNFVGKAKILDTPNGKIVKSLLDGGAQLGVSTRGVGSLKPHNGYQLVQDDFRLSCAADIVADPSAPSAFVQGIMENHEWILENGNWKEMDYENAKKTIKSANRNEVEAIALKLFEGFISKL
jgi:hypothetical protein